jgi:hypothetical protein
MADSKPSTITIPLDLSPTKPRLLPSFSSARHTMIVSAGIELAQLTIPGRHARLSDFFVDAIAICVGIFAGSTLIRMRPHREAIIGSRSAK